MPPPRRHLTRYHGVFAPHHALRAAIIPAGRGRGAGHTEAAAEGHVPEHASMTWMQRLKRVFAIDIERCRRCGGKLKVIASLEDPAAIERILAHLKPPPQGEPPRSRVRRAARAPEAAGASAIASRCAVIRVASLCAVAGAVLDRPCARKRRPTGSTECATAVLDVEGDSAHDIFGSPDDLKLRSCATLFALVSPPESVFSRLLAKYFEGQHDEQTLRLLGRDV